MYAISNTASEQNVIKPCSMVLLMYYLNHLIRTADSNANWCTHLGIRHPTFAILAPVPGLAHPVLRHDA
jgi:hypothetical protein